MKAKKALKKLSKVEGLLSEIIDQFPGSKDQLAHFLDSAKGAVRRAVETIQPKVSKKAGKTKSPARAETAHPGHPSANGGKRISPAAKRGGAAAKRNGASAASGQRLSKTA